MRILSCFLALILWFPSHAAASGILELFFFNSDVTFGLSEVDQDGFDLEASFDPFFELGASTFTLHTGQFVSLTGPFGVPPPLPPPWWEYQYTGGTFDVDIFDDNGFQGSFVAPVLTLALQATNRQPGSVPCDDFDGCGSALLFATLGPGAFDAALAQAFGLPLFTTGGTVFSDLLLTDVGNRGCCAGDNTSPERQAWDGATWVELQVPEPSLLVLGGLGLSAWFWRRRAPLERPDA
jgi:PEP-CTERM motif-containing protein